MILVVKSKISRPREVPATRWALFVWQMFIFLHSEFEQTMYRKDPRSDTFSSVQLDDFSGVLHTLQPPSRASAKTPSSTSCLPLSWKASLNPILATELWLSLADHLAFIATKRFFIRLSFLWLQNLPYLCVLAPSRLAFKVGVILDVTMRRRGVQSKTRESPCGALKFYCAL